MRFQHAAQHGLAAADLAADFDDALALGNRIHQRVEDRPAITAGEKERSIRCDFERGLAEAVVLVVHAYSSAPG